METGEVVLVPEVQEQGQGQEVEQPDAVETAAAEPVDYEQIADLVSGAVVEGMVEVGLDGVSSKVDGLTDDAAGLASDVAAVRSAVDELGESTASEGVVVIDDAQWREMQDAWGWCKQGLSVAVFLVLVLTLLVAAVLGNRLWAAMSEGWRTKSA